MKYFNNRSRPTPIPRSVSQAPAPTTPSNPPLTRASTLPASSTHSQTFRLARLPHTHPVSLTALLSSPPHQTLLRHADASRSSLHTTLSNARDPALLSRVITHYLPYALAVSDLARRLSIHAPTPDPPVLTWTSGLSQAPTPLTAPVPIEACMLLSLAALNLIRPIVETCRQFGASPSNVLVQQIKNLQTAAGILVHLRDIVAPKTLADFDGPPPPELCPSVANMLHCFALALAQTLHVRRAILSNMSLSTLSRLAAGAHKLVDDLQRALHRCRREDVPLSPDFAAVVHEVGQLVVGWLYEFSVDGFQSAGPKVAALRAALGHITKASGGMIVAEVASERVEAIRKKLDDAIKENRVISQEGVPELSDLRLPSGRILVSATPFQLPVVPKAENGESVH